MSMLREATKTRLILWTGSGSQNAILDVGNSEALAIGDAVKRVGWTVKTKRLKEMKRNELQTSNDGSSQLSASTSTVSNGGLGSGHGNGSAVLGSALGKWEAALMKLEYRMASRFASYKFGILYVKAGQKTEEEMFSNRVSSRAFRNFCKMLGAKVELRDWPLFSGGLDTKSDRTGTHSIYTQHSGYEIMFHVSTMLPWNDSDQQQIDRKRHIGNDVVVVAFIDEDAKDAWCPTIISSRFPHLYAVVKPLTNPDDGSTSYLFNLAVRDNVSSFGPPLPNPPLFDDPQAFRFFLLSKLINGEREAIRTVPDFHQSSAHLSDLQDLFDKVNKDQNSSSNSSSSSSVAGKGERSDKIDSKSGALPPSNNNPAVSFVTEKDSIAALSTSPRMLGTVHAMGVSSPSLFGSHHHHYTSTPLSRDSMMGGSFNLPSGASSRDLRSQLSPISGSPSSKSSQGSLPASLSQPPSSVDQSKRTYPIAPLSMYAATEQIQAFQNRPSMMNFPTEITCADAWEGSLLVGTVDGLYVLEGAQETDPKLLEVKCQLQRNQPYRRNAYQQITIIEDLNIVLALIPKAGVVMYDLTCIAAHTQPPEMLLRKSKMATLYALGTYHDNLQLAISTPRGIVIHRWQDDSFVLSQIIQLTPPTVMEFDSKGYIIAAVPGEFFWVKPDPDSPTMNAMYAWSEKDRPLEPISVLLFEDTSEYLLCFDTVAFYVNIAGQRTRGFEFKFWSRPTSVVCVFPYLLAFSKQHLEVRYLANGSLAQFLELDSRVDSTIKFMSTFHGIQYATVSANTSPTSGNSAQDSSSYKPGTGKEAKDLTSSSGSSTATNPLPTAPASSHGAATVLHSPSVSSSASSTSTIHTLRLNTVHTCIVANPLQISYSTLGNSSFLVPGLPHHPALSPESQYSMLPATAMSKQTRTQQTRANQRRSGGLIPGPGAGAGPGPSGNVSAGSSPHSPGGSVLQQYFGNDGTASFDDSEDAIRFSGGNGLPANPAFKPYDDALAGALYRRKSSTGRDGRTGMMIGSVGSVSSAGSASTHSTGGTGTPIGVFGQNFSMGMRYKDERMGGKSSPLRLQRYEELSATGGGTRLTSSAKISRRKSLALDSETGGGIKTSGSKTEQPELDDDFDFEPERLGDSSDSPRFTRATSPKLLQADTPTGTPTKKNNRRTASDKLSGSSERSPRSSPLHLDLESKKSSRRLTATAATSSNQSSHKRVPTSGSNDSPLPSPADSPSSEAMSQLLLQTMGNADDSAGPAAKKAARLSTKRSRKSLGSALTSAEINAAFTEINSSDTKQERRKSPSPGRRHANPTTTGSESAGSPASLASPSGVKKKKSTLALDSTSIHAAVQSTQAHPNHAPQISQTEIEAHFAASLVPQASPFSSSISSISVEEKDAKERKTAKVRQAASARVLPRPISLDDPSPDPHLRLPVPAHSGTMSPVTTPTKKKDGSSHSAIISPRAERRKTSSKDRTTTSGAPSGSSERLLTSSPNSPETALRIPPQETTTSSDSPIGGRKGGNNSSPSLAIPDTSSPSAGAHASVRRSESTTSPRASTSPTAGSGATSPRSSPASGSSSTPKERRKSEKKRPKEAGDGVRRKDPTREKSGVSRPAPSSDPSSDSNHSSPSLTAATAPRSTTDD